MVLSGLVSVEDITWEDWDTLFVAYHLDDKVFFLGKGDHWKLDPSNIVGDRELTIDG